MSSDKLPDFVINALIENTKTIEANTTTLNEIKGNDDKQLKKEENVLQKPKVESSLTTDEAKRYAEIGKELFSPVFSSLEKMLKKEKKNSEMLIKNDKKTIHRAAKKQEKQKTEKKDGAFGWWPLVVGLIGIAAGAIYAFKNKIVSFFENAWTWIKDMFNSVLNFFSFENGNNPVARIVNVIGSGLSSLWEGVKNVFNKLKSIGPDIWAGIKGAWDRFITGPNGILNFGSKIMSNLIDFAKGAAGNIGSSILNAITAPIKRIFGKAEEDGKKSGDEAAAEVKTVVSQAAAEQAAKNKAITDKVMFNAEMADKAIIETAEAQRKEALAKAKEVGITTGKDGKGLDKESMKLKVAEDSLRNFLSENGADFDKLNKDQQKEITELMAKHTAINDKGEASIDMEKVKEALNTAKSDGFFFDSDEINLLQGADQAKINSMQETAAKSLQDYMQLNADLLAADKLKNMSEEEKFEMRLRQAMAAGKSAEFRFMEGRKMILDSIGVIQTAFLNYDKTIQSNFTSTWASFVKDFLSKIQLNIVSASSNDNSINTYHITPLNKESFANLSNNLLRLAKINNETIEKQNEILDDIKEILEDDSTVTQVINSPIVQGAQKAVETAANYVTTSAKKHIKELWSSVTSWA